MKAPTAQALTLDDLDRDELLYFIRQRYPFIPTQRDLWRARWEILGARAMAAMKASHAAERAYGEAVQARFAAGLTRIERGRRDAIADRLDAAAKRARAASARADRAEQAAYAALDASQ